MDLSIIIVNWQTRDYLKNCLKSIFDNLREIDYEIFVVDNNSKDGSVEMVKNQFPQVNLIVNSKNEGFAQANNLALEKAHGRFILLLNPDTLVIDNSFKKALDFLEKNPQVGILGGKILNPDFSLQPSVRAFPDFLSQTLILLKLHHLFPNFFVFKKYFCQNFNYKEKQEVDQVMGAFFFVRREVLEQIGFFDENFHIWFEEVDFCFRAKKAGWKVVYFPETQIVHFGGRSFAQVLPWTKQKIFNQSLIYFFKKHHSKTEWFFLRFLFHPLSLVLALFSSFLIWLRWGKK